MTKKSILVLVLGVLLQSTSVFADEASTPRVDLLELNNEAASSGVRCVYINGVFAACYAYGARMPAYYCLDNLGCPVNPSQN